jgi:hypothetical protein
LGTGAFWDTAPAKTVTVKVPSGATGYGPVSATYSGSNDGPNWGNGFRGRGWTGWAFATNEEYVYFLGQYIPILNSNITLHVQYQ